MLSLPSSVAYVHEPFNVTYYAGASSARPEHWFQYVCDENAERFFGPLGRTFGLQADLRARLASARTTKERLRVCRTELRFAWYRALGARPLVKDPLAVFSTPWIARRFNATVVVLVRHPAAFVASLQKAGWHFDFNQWRAQPLLMRDQLGRFRDEIDAAARGRMDIVDQGILLWNGIYSAMQALRATHPDWHFVRHEDLAREPIAGFEALYGALGLPFGETVARRIDRFSARGNAGDDAASPFEVRRDSRAIVHGWKDRLAPADIVRVREATAEWWPAFYEPSDW